MCLKNVTSVVFFVIFTFFSSAKAESAGSLQKDRGGGGGGHYVDRITDDLGRWEGREGVPVWDRMAEGTVLVLIQYLVLLRGSWCSSHIDRLAPLMILTKE